MIRRLTGSRFLLLLPLLAVALAAGGCAAAHHRQKVDGKAYRILDAKRQSAFGQTHAFTVEPAADQLRRRMLVGQNLPFASQASLGSAFLDPAPHWPESRPDPESLVIDPIAATLQLSLHDALRIAAANSRDYQARKESVFRSALSLELERDQFRSSLLGVASAVFAHDRSRSDGETREQVATNAITQASQALGNGSTVSLRLGWDLLKLLHPQEFLSRSLVGDATIAIPLLRGSGRHIAGESLTQAERNTLYALYEFEQFKRSFAVRIAADYLSALQRADAVRNTEENYRGLIAASRRARWLLDAGKLPPIQVDQALQDELRARNRWISARAAQAAALDSFKVLLGLPADASIELDREEFPRLTAAMERYTDTSSELNREEVVPPADAPIILVEPSLAEAGPWELDPESAIRIAFNYRLDLRIAEGRVYDAQRRVVVAADRLRPGLNLVGRARSRGARLSDLSLETAAFEAAANLDLPLNTTSAAISYRDSLLRLEDSTRSVQALEDEIKLGIRDRLRSLREARESLRIQGLSVELANRRVRGADLNLQAGRIPIRDLLEAREALLAAQNALTAASVSYRLAELQLQRDLGLLQVGPDGLWSESNPQDLPVHDPRA
jgi:outer membrane protein TolC